MDSVSKLGVVNDAGSGRGDYCSVHVERTQIRGSCLVPVHVLAVLALHENDSSNIHCTGAPLLG